MSLAMTGREEETLRNMCHGLPIAGLLDVMIACCVARRSGGSLTNEEAALYGKLQRRLESAQRHAAEHDL